MQVSIVLESSRGLAVPLTYLILSNSSEIRNAIIPICYNQLEFKENLKTHTHYHLCFAVKEVEALRDG